LKGTKQLTFIFLIFIIILSGCNMPGRGLSPSEQTAQINTSVAESVTADAQTQFPNGDQALSTDTPEPGSGETITPSTDTPAPDTATPSDTPIPCNLGRFITDVTIPDGKVFEPGDTFTKTWRLRNVGSCAWTSGYDIVFSGGDAMSAPSSVQITTGTVNPGQNVDVSVDLVAPSSAGTYRGNWQLRDPSDVIFGIQNSNSGFFWVEIEVIVPTDTPEPVTVTLNRHSNSKTTGVSGISSDIWLGIAPNGDPSRAFLDFDLSTLSGLSSSSTIESAELDVSDFTGNSCFEFLHPLKAGQIDFGTTPDYPSDFNQTPTATLFSVSSGAGISSPIDITDILQDFVEDEGAGHFQFRMELEHDDAGAAFACKMTWPDPEMTITYLP
jgi:hypothetical protein